MSYCAIILGNITLYTCIGNVVKGGNNMTNIAQAAKSGIKAFSNAVNRLAIKDKAFAEELVFRHKIRGEINPNALKQITKDMFEKSGKLTTKGQQEVNHLIERFKLPKNATWDDILAALKSSKAEVIAKVVTPIKTLDIPKFDKSKLVKMIVK